VSRWQLPRWAREGNARIARGRTPAGLVHLMKPLTYMNDSGRALKGLRAAPGESIPDLLILVDDFALDVGTFRLRAAGSAGGHNGLKSVEATLGSRNYARLRIGVGPKPAGVDQAAFVLDDLPRDERVLVKELMPQMCEAVECWAAQGIERAMASYNRKQVTDDEQAS
jgi:PTH1 family peptidyl-tRNA hydrolase